MNPAKLLKDRVFKPKSTVGTALAAGEANLARYCALVDDWDIYDNSGPMPVLILEKTL
jgi:predicted ABC-type ATPase